MSVQVQAEEQRYNRQQIRDLATELLINVGVREQFPTPLEDIIHYLGYTIEEFEPDEDTDRVSGAVNHRQQTIYINHQDSPRRQMFTLAHEIGHIFLHRELEGSHVDYRDGAITPREQEANHFAAELLMPENHFRHTWMTWEGEPELVAATYGVSAEAVRVRADILKLA